MTSAKNYNYGINGLRGLCILMVFVHHIANSGILPDVDSYIYRAAMHLFSTFRYGVEIFFMISGYVIYNSLKRHASFKSFIVDRFIRIHPTWIPILICLFVFGPIVGRGIFESFDPMIWSSTFISNLFFLPPIIPFPLAHPAAWSLSYEWLFYLISGLGVYYLMPRRGKITSFALLFIISVFFINFFPRGLYFISGIIVARNEDKIKSYSKYFILPSLSFFLFLFIWEKTGASYAEIYQTVLEYSLDSRIIYLLLAFIFGTYMFATITLGNGLITKLLDTPVFQFLGNISYAFYLWSPICMMVGKILAVKFVEPHFGDWASVGFFAVSSFIASIIVSYLNWLIIEQRFTKYIKSRIAKRREAAYAG